MSDPDAHADRERAADPDVPAWDDEYLDRVSDRLRFNYDLEKDVAVDGETFALYGRMEMAAEKHFLHPALRFGYHESVEHVFAGRSADVSVAALERFVDLGHDLADGWIDPDEEHYSTEFAFVTVVDRIPEAVREFVSGFRDRTLIRFGYYGHYEVHLIVVAPGREDLVASREAGVEEAFRLWDPIEPDEPGLWKLITRRLQL